MAPAEIKRLREQLACGIREFADALDVDMATLLAWEMGERFPTKRHVGLMLALEKKGPDAIARRPKPKATTDPLGRLADPKLWELLRKLAAHADLFDQVQKLAEPYSDPSHKS